MFCERAQTSFSYLFLQSAAALSIKSFFLKVLAYTTHSPLDTTGRSSTRSRSSLIGTASLVALTDRSIWRFPDQWGADDGLRDGPETRPDGQFRRTKGGDRPAQVICEPSEPILAEIHRPDALAMVQCATRHFEQKLAEGGHTLCVSNSVFY